MKEEEVVPLPSREANRQTTFGFNSQEHDQMAQLVSNLVQTHRLALPALIQAFRNFPSAREQTKLLQHIFSQPQLVRDMISFLVQPRRVAPKYNLSLDQLPRYIYQLSVFMHDNLQFYQFYFVLLENNSQLKEEGEQWRREVKNLKEGTFYQWFQFLQDPEINQDQKHAALGYIAEIFIPLVKYEYSSSSRVLHLLGQVNDYYEERYKNNQPPILLISHFSDQLITLLCRHSHHEAIFNVLFTLVLVSLEEQEWVQSLRVLTQLCGAAIANNVTSDKHIENIYKMIKEVANNISNDKNRTVFAFISAIINSSLVEATLNRLKQFPQETDPDPMRTEQIIEINVNFIAGIVDIYYLLLKNGIDKNANKMIQLKQNVIQIKDSLPQLISLVRKMPRGLMNFSNGEALRRTPLFALGVFKVIKNLFQIERDFHLGVEVENEGLIELIQECLGENRWNSILHSTIEHIVGYVITTECFKAKSPSLQKFLQFLIEYSTNKKYVFLNSTRMTNQGDTRSLYNICCKVTLSFEKACKSFGISNDYQEWGSFVVNVLQKYLPTTQRTNSAFLPLDSSICFESQDLHASVDSQRQEAFTGYIDEATQMKESISRIDIVQKWKINKNQKKAPLQRTCSYQKLEKRNSKEITDKNASPSGKPKLLIPTEMSSKSLLEPKFAKKMSQSGTFTKENDKEELPKPPMIALERTSSWEKSMQEESSFENVFQIKKADSLPGEKFSNLQKTQQKSSEFGIEQPENKRSA